MKTKATSSEQVAFLVGRRQVMAGQLRSALLDAENRRVGIAPLTESNNPEIQHELKLIRAALELLATPRLPVAWARKEQRYLGVVNKGIRVQEANELAVKCQVTLPAADPPFGVSDSEDCNVAGQGGGQFSGASAVPPPALEVCNG